jgi:single-strand DNA-binding protein
MSDLNAWSFTGRLTKDAEFKTLASDKSLLVMDVAVNTGFGDYKKTTYVKVQQWGVKNTNTLPYLKKGTLIGVTGEVTLNEWESKTDGTKRMALQVDTSKIQILSSKKDEGSSSSVPEPPSDPVF